MTNETGSRFFSRLMTVAFSGAALILVALVLITGEAPLFADTGR